MDARYAAALQRFNSGAPVPWSSSGSYVEDLQRQLNPSHHNTFERAMEFRMREKEHLASISEERDSLRAQLRDAKLERLKMQHTLDMQNSNYKLLLNGKRTRNRNSGSRGPSPVRDQPPPDSIGSGQGRRQIEQQHDNEAADSGGGGPPSAAPDLGGHAGEHGAQERTDGSEPVASVPSAEGAVCEGGE